VATKAQALAALDEHGAKINNVKGVEGVGLGTKSGRFFVLVHAALGAVPPKLPTKVKVVVGGKRVDVPVVLDKT
jgi:hypothetical protein